MATRQQCDVDHKKNGSRSTFTAFAASVPSLPSPLLTVSFSNERGGRNKPPCSFVKNAIDLFSQNECTMIVLS